MWQWLHHGSKLDDGRTIDKTLADQIVAEEMEKTRAQIGDERYQASKFTQAAKLFSEMATATDFSEFLTLPAYDIVRAA